MIGETIKCAECGVEFVQTAPNQVYCSRQCQNHHFYRHRVDYRKAFADAIRAVTVVPLGELTRAKTKPRNCSDVRWRIELRRRKNAEYYQMCGGVV